MLTVEKATIFNSNHFSTDDTGIADASENREQTGYKSWLGTPDHSVKQYDPKTGKETDVTPKQSKTGDSAVPASSGSAASSQQNDSVCSRQHGGCGPGGGAEIWGN